MPNELKPTLRPCPFCGGEVSAKQYLYDEYFVSCEKCGALVVFGEKGNIADKWNRRVKNAE